MLARLIDFLIMLAGTAIIYFAIVYPNTFDSKKFEANSKEMIALYSDSGLYVTNTKGQYAAKSNFKTAMTTVASLSDATINLDGYVTEHNNLVKDLYEYYTTDLNIKYGGQIKFNDETFASTILKVGTEESNIASYYTEDEEGNRTFMITVIDESKATTTVSFFLSAFESAATTVDTSSIIKTVVDENNNMVLFTLLMIVPVMAGVSLILDGIVPTCTPYGQTIGKFIFHLIVLTSDGHKVPKYKQLFRWVIYFLELAFGIATFGGGLLISYTMFLFTKKRQTIHDFACSTVVVDGERSIFYDSAKEEAYITNRLKEKGLDLDEPVNQSTGSGEE